MSTVPCGTPPAQRKICPSTTTAPVHSLSLIHIFLEEKNDLVGTARRIDGRLKFVPDDCPAISMQMMRDCEGGAKDGDKVAVEILQRGNRQEDHRVGVAMRFGSSDEAKRCAKALLYAQDIHSRFPDKVREEAKKLENAEVSEKDTEGRMDLRALPIYTIDSAETKDIDDAISLTKTPESGFELGVHIADVSNYVKPGSELDNEAFNRATSVYYADQVVPCLLYTSPTMTRVIRKSTPACRKNLTAFLKSKRQTTPIWN